MSEQEFISFEEPNGIYHELLYKDDVYNIISCCFEVHKTLGKGFSEVVYKDALSIELELKKIPFEREKQFNVYYKNVLLQRKYNCDFVVYDKIVLEAKAQTCLTEADVGQVVNYLAVTKCKVGLLVNFGESSLKFRRIVL